MDPITSEAIEAMRQGGLQIVESATEKWWSGQYMRGDPKAIRENVARWKRIGERIAELTRQLKAM